MCSHPHCGQSFTREMTLRVHERSHEAYADYHRFKQLPQLVLDADSRAMVMENTRRYLASTSLPPLAQQQLDAVLQRMSLRQQHQQQHQHDDDDDGDAAVNASNKRRTVKWFEDVEEDDDEDEQREPQTQHASESVLPLT